MVVDALASFSFDVGDCVWVEEYPDEVHDLIQKDIS